VVFFVHTKGNPTKGESMNTIELTNNKHTKKDFIRMRSVLACASKDSTRPAINLVLVEAVKGGITVTATDGKRLRSDKFKLKAEPGLYEIKTSNAKVVFLAESNGKLVFPTYEQVIPVHGKRVAYALSGKGKKFVLWAASALGCYLDPKLVTIGDDEFISLYIQKSAPELSPALLKNKDTTMVVMPFTGTDGWSRELETIKQDLFKRREKERKAA